jgi:tetratricopeptide (TPR) repeat protein
MLSFVLRFLRILSTLSAVLGAAPVCAGQNGPNAGGIIGAIINSAVINEIRDEWRRRPAVDFSCLEAHGVSADQLAANGVGPKDPRVQQMFAECARDAANRPPATIAAAAPTGPYNPDFVIEGLAVGGAVHPDSAIYRAYKCRSSEEFAGFTWCSIKHSLSGKLGPYDSWLTILHSDANTATFIMQDVIPAFFSSGDVEREIQRLSQHFGQTARIYTEPRLGSLHSVIATWGDVTLTPLDQPTMDAIGRGDRINAGLLIDFLADSGKSARQGLPVFHMGGGSGYVWAAMFDESGRGRLRITAVNPSLLPATASATAPADPSSDLHECRNSKDAADRIARCSNVIAVSRNVPALVTAHNTRGLALLEVGRFREAIDDFGFVITREPNVAGFYDNRESAYRQSRMFNEALSDANKAIQLAPTDSFVFRGRANVYNDMDRYDLALQDYDEAIRLSPEDGGLFIDRGKILRTESKFDEAISDFSHAIDLDKKWTGAYRERGLTYKMMGQTERAVADLTTYDQLQPGDQDVALALAESGHQQPSPPPSPVTPPHSPLQPFRDELSHIEIDKLTQDLKDERRSLLTALAEKERQPASLTDEAIAELSKLTQAFIDKVNEFQEKENVFDDIKKLRDLAESKIGSVNDEGLQDTIKEQLTLSAPASPELPTSDLKKMRSGLQDAMWSVAHYYELQQLREVVRDRIRTIRERLLTVVGEVPELDALDEAVDSLDKGLTRDTLSSLQIKLNDLNNLYEADKLVIDKHIFKQF